MSTQPQDQPNWSPCNLPYQANQVSEKKVKKRLRELALPLQEADKTRYHATSTSLYKAETF